MYICTGFSLPSVAAVSIGAAVAVACGAQRHVGWSCRRQSRAKGVDAGSRRGTSEGHAARGAHDIQREKTSPLPVSVCTPHRRPARPPVSHPPLFFLPSQPSSFPNCFSFDLPIFSFSLCSIFSFSSCFYLLYRINET